jgi:hypothetical protein
MFPEKFRMNFSSVLFIFTAKKQNEDPVTSTLMEDDIKVLVGSLISLLQLRFLLESDDP